jgi:2-methylisocitrate lyase-like PEP mutase family enzyme
VREYEQAGVSALHLEDQVVPRRSQGCLPEVVPAEEHAAKIRAAVTGRRGRDLLIIGRTDCVERLGLDEAIRRGNLYARAGADIVFVHGIRTAEELRAVGRRVKGPKLLNYTALSLAADDFRPTLATVRAWGFSVVIFAIEPLLASIGACTQMLGSLRRGKPGGTRLPPFRAWKAGMDRAIRAAEYRTFEGRHLPAEPGDGSISG